MASSVSHAVTGVILAGGKSRRMGQNKALMRLGQQRLIDRVVEAVQAVCGELLMVTNTPDLYADVGLPMVPDLIAGAGSLGGIYSALCHAGTPHCLVVACDMPFVRPAMLRYLIAQIADYDVVIPEVLSEPQPLHAIYGQACVQPMARCIAARRLRIIGFFPEVRVRTVSESELTPFDPALHAFRNLNTPEDFQRAERELGA